MIAVGTLIGGRFRVEEVLGVGGMGVVVAALHVELGHRVAIKLLHDDMARVPIVVERFIREARSVVQLRTEHVCRVTDVGRLDSGVPYIVMELLEGDDLGKLVKRGALPVAVAVDYVLQACVALAEAHAAGVIHRDLKPANLFVTHRLDGSPLVKVLDFGIAKAVGDEHASLTHQHDRMGSAGYTSPEQLMSARDVDARTDVWALGVTLYQLVSGRMPFDAPTPTEIAVRVAADPPHPLELAPARLREVILRCLEKTPSDRYASVGELAGELAAALPTSVHTKPAPAPAWRPRWWMVALAMVGLCGLGVGAAFAVDALTGHAEPAAAGPAVAPPAPVAPASTPVVVRRPTALPQPELPAVFRTPEWRAKQTASCKRLLDPKLKLHLPPEPLGLCHCMLADAPAARAVYARLTDPNIRMAMRLYCAQNNITLDGDGGSDGDKPTL